MPARLAVRALVATLVLCAALVAATQAQARAATRAAVAPFQAMSAMAAPSRAATSATITPSLTPDRPGAKAALTFTIRYAGGEFGVPASVRRSILRFPAGLSLSIPRLRGCSAARLLARGADACPPQSKIGSGRALIEVHAGTLTIAEQVTLQAFLGPPKNLQPTFEILARGYSPLQERRVFTGTVLPDRAPYGEELMLSIPPIPSLPLEPDASIVRFSLTIGANKRPEGHGTNAVIVPTVCPAGGFPFAAEFTYADGTSGRALATVPCGGASTGDASTPGASTRDALARGASTGHALTPSVPAPALAARTFSLNESGRLRLTSKHGFTLNERGSASGTVAGTIYVHLTIVSTNRVRAEVNIYPPGGSISGEGTASYLRGNTTASFSGSVAIDRGSGSYAHAHGQGLSFSGTIARSDDAVTVRLSGRVRT